MACLRGKVNNSSWCGVIPVELRNRATSRRGCHIKPRLDCKQHTRVALAALPAAATMHTCVHVPETDALVDAAVARTIKMFQPEPMSLQQTADICESSSSCEVFAPVTLGVEDIEKEKAIQQARAALKQTKALYKSCTEAAYPEHIVMHVRHLVEGYQQLVALLENSQQKQTATAAMHRAVDTTVDTSAVSTSITDAVDMVTSHPIAIDTDLVAVEALASQQQLARILSGMAATRGKRSYMEDFSTSNSLHPDAGVLPAAQHDSSNGSTFMAAVYDGHGGRSTAAFAAAHMPNILHQQLYSSSSSNAADGADSRQVMTQVFKQLDQMCEYEGQPDRSGSTAVVALVRDNKLVVANAGDSVAVLCRNGQAMRLTATHNTSNPDEVARVTAAGGQMQQTSRSGAWKLKQNPVRVQRYMTSLLLSVTRGFGDYGFKGVGGDLVVPSPHVTEVDLSHDDKIVLLTSDGVTDVMSVDEMVKVAMNAVDKARSEGAPSSQLAHIAAAAVKDKAMEKGAWDNVTVTALLLDWDTA